MQEPDVGRRAEVPDRLVNAMPRKGGGTCAEDCKVNTPRSATPRKPGLTIGLQLAVVQLESPLGHERDLVPVVAFAQNLPD